MPNNKVEMCLAIEMKMQTAVLDYQNNIGLDSLLRASSSEKSRDP